MKRVFLPLLLLASPLFAVEKGFMSPGLTPGELQERLSSPGAPLVIDVRKPAEFGAAHVPGAANIPLDEQGAVTQ